MRGQADCRIGRAEKTFLAGREVIRRRLNAEARELDWLDKNLELLRSGKTTELRKLWKTTDGR